MREADGGWGAEQRPAASLNTRLHRHPLIATNIVDSQQKRLVLRIASSLLPTRWLGLAIERMMNHLGISLPLLACIQVRGFVHNKSKIHSRTKTKLHMVTLSAENMEY
ncbi:hypothetical protein EYC84_000287 [Monilinia fructicola]|nr:hypothetical protein EYC84_000287 [Monilinia fructicola]